MIRRAITTLARQGALRNYALSNSRTVTLIPGDGLGPEITESVQNIFSAATVPVNWDVQQVSGMVEDEKEENLILPKVDESIMRNKVVLKGPFYTPVATGHTSIDKILALKYDLFAHVVPCKSPQGPFPMKYKDVDMVIIRENTEAEYSGIDHEVVPGVVEDIKVVTRVKSQRIARYAFEYARTNKHKKVIAVHKANIMKLSDGLFLDCCREVSKQFPEVQYEELIVDNTAMQLVRHPKKFDNSVLVTTNLYGSIVSNIAVGLVGGPGVIGGFNTGPDVFVFEQGARHVGLDIAGKNVANPVGLIRSAVMMLNHMNLTTYAERIKNALNETLAEGKTLTPDLGGKATTTEFTNELIARMKQ